LVFDFTGDDDLWIFVNNHLAVDLGGLNNRVSDTFDVDKRNISLGLGLANGQTYNMDIFYAERNPIGSNLIIQTTLDLQNSAQLFYVATVLGPGKTQYLITEHVQSMEKTCGFTPLVNRIDTPTVNFFIQGPQFAKPMLLAPGSYFNKGVTVDISKTKVTLDSTTLDTSLLPGIYHISFTSTFDSTRTGYLVFTVPPLPPNHLDILNDSLTLNPSQDAMLDSVFIAMDQPTTQVYAVLRDKLGNYTAIASGATWLSRDTSIVTVGTFPGDKSRCIITKTGTGSTWVVVSQAGLKPDSVRVSAIALPKYPIISSAVMQDTNADLIPDMVSITLNDTFKVNQQLDSIIISYRGTTYAIAAAKAVVNGVSIKAPVTPTTGIDCRPTGQVTMVLTADGASKRYSKPFTDGVDPAIISANVMENDNTGADTLFVTFSEPIPASAISGNQLLLIKAASGDTLSLTITQALKQTNDSSFTIQVTSSGLQPKAGDRLRLLPGSQGGTIVDQSKNTPHDLNRSVLLGLRLGPTAIVNTWYRDDNADGVIDQVIINFKRPVQAASFKTITAKWDILPSIVLDTVSLSGLQKINDSSYSMPVHGEKAMPGRLSTDVAMELLVDYTDFPDLPPRSALVADSAGPVLVSAKLVYGNTLAADSSRFDILTTSFSENVKPITDSHPFLLQSMKDGKQYQLRLTPLTTSNGTCTFKVDTIEAGLEPYAAKGDSMWIDVKALVTDAKGNAQINPVNRRVALDVVMKEPDWLVQAVPNPFSPAQGLAEITVGSKTPVMNADEYTLSIAIFDVVGNMVITLPLKPKNKGWAVPWDGRNKNGRSVSSGVYLGIVNVLHNNALVATKRIKIGVKR
jgi:fibro-slime domain-containing protein